MNLRSVFEPSIRKGAFPRASEITRWACVAAICVLTLPAATLSVDRAAGRAGDRITVEIHYAAQTEHTSRLQFDVDYDEGAIDVAAAAGPVVIAGRFQSYNASRNRIRFVIGDSGDPALSDG